MKEKLTTQTPVMNKVVDGLYGYKLPRPTAAEYRACSVFTLRVYHGKECRTYHSFDQVYQKAHQYSFNFKDPQRGFSNLHKLVMERYKRKGYTCLIYYNHEDELAFHMRHGKTVKFMEIDFNIIAKTVQVPDFSIDELLHKELMNKYEGIFF